MTMIHVRVTLTNGTRLNFPLTDQEFEWIDDVPSLRRTVITRRARELGLRVGRRQIQSIEFKGLSATDRRPSGHIRASSRRATGHCRSVLSLAYLALPLSTRQDALDEWLDEIACAEVAGRPVVRRTLSIIVRTLPRLAARSRLPIRARGKGG